MAASFIDQTFVQIYHDNVILALQQKGSRLRSFVINDELKGERDSYDSLDKDDDVTTLTDDDTSVDTRHPNTVITDPTWTRRWVSGSFLTKAYLLEQKDKVRRLSDPTNAYIQNIAYAIGRKIDRLILAASIGTAYTGKDGTTAVTLPDTQIVKADYKSTGTAEGLTYKKLMGAKKIFDKADIDQDEPRYLITNADQIYNLLDDLASTNLTRDADTVRAIAQGSIDSYMGFQFIMTNLTPTETVTLSDNTTTTDADDVIAFTQQGLLAAFNAESTAKIDPRPDKNYATQIFFGLEAGAVRMDEKRVVKVECAKAQ